MKPHNPSECRKANKEIENQLNEIVDINYLRMNMETEQATICLEKDLSCPSTAFAATIWRLGLSKKKLYPYKCECEDFNKLSDTEILKINGYPTW